MNSEKKMMIASLILLAIMAVIGFALKDVRLDKEGRLIDEIEAMNIEEFDEKAHYTPSTAEEKIPVLQDYVNKLEAVQKKISDTIVTKHILDFSDLINELQDEISTWKELEGSETYNQLSFLTAQDHSLFADPEFTRESLLKLAPLIDNTFPNKMGNASFVLQYEYGYLQLTILPYDDPEPFYKVDLEEFAVLISDDIFNGDPIFIDIDVIEDEEEAMGS